MKCPRCNYEWKLPGPQAGGRAKVAKGFAVAGQPDDATRKRAWKTRKRKYRVACLNPDCGWCGNRNECTTDPDIPNEPLCPECQATVDMVSA